MRIVTEAELRQRIRKPNPGLVLTFPPGTRFSPAAQDFLRDWRIAVRFVVESQDDDPGSDMEPPAERTRRRVEALAAAFRLVAGRAMAVRLPALSRELTKVAEYVDQVAKGGQASPPVTATSSSGRPAHAPSTDDPEVLGWLQWLWAEVRKTQTSCGVDPELAKRLTVAAETVDLLSQRFRSGELAWQLTGLSKS